MTLCYNCGIETQNPKFCTRSCAAKTTNKIPKRKSKLFTCKLCGSSCQYRRQYCKSCFPQVDWSNISLQDVRGKRAYQKNSRIRGLARKSVEGIRAECQVCGYNKHVEVCHIKAISSYNKLTSVSEINQIDNLAFLCPNHHWELDNGHLSVLSLRDKVPIF